MRNYTIDEFGNTKCTPGLQIPSYIQPTAASTTSPSPITGAPGGTGATGPQVPYYYYNCFRFRINCFNSCSGTNTNLLAYLVSKVKTNLKEYDNVRSIFADELSRLAIITPVKLVYFPMLRPYSWFNLYLNY